MKRSASVHILSLSAEQLLITLGGRIRLARRARRMTLPDLAAIVGIGTSTMRQIEQGAPTVQIGFYISALWAMDLLDELHSSVQTLGRASSTVVLLEQDANSSGSSPKGGRS